MLLISSRKIWFLQILLLLLLTSACSAAPQEATAIPAVPDPTEILVQPTSTSLSTAVVPTMVPTQTATAIPAEPTLLPTETLPSIVPGSRLAALLGGRADDSLDLVVPWQGGWALAGWTESFGAGDKDLWLVSMSSDSAVRWQFTLGGTGQETPYALLPVANGDLLVLARTNSFGRGEMDGWVLRISPEGSVLWQKTIGGRYFDSVFDAQETDAGHFVLVGSQTRTGETYNAEGWIIELDADGVLVWQTVLGGPEFDRLWTALPAGDGGWLAAGELGRKGDGWIVRLDSTGEILWQQVYGGAGSDAFTHSLRTKDGGTLLAGYTSSAGQGKEDLWLVKLDSAGAVLWQNAYGHSDGDFLKELIEQPDGSLVLAAAWYEQANGDLLAAGLSADGSLRWQHLFSGVDSLEFGGGLAQVQGEGYLMVGQSNGFQAQEFDALLITLDEEGRCVACPASGTEGALLVAPVELVQVEKAARQMDALANQLVTNVIPQEISALQANPICKDAAVPAVNSLVAQAGQSDQLPDMFDMRTGETRDPGDASSWVVRLVPQQGAARLGVSDLLPADEEGGVFLAGSVWQQGEDIWLARMNVDGSLAWQQRYGTPGNERYQAAVPIAGGLAAAALGEELVHIWKVDVQGRVEWQTAFALGGDPEETSVGLAPLDESNLVAAWVEGRDVLHVARLEGDGSLIWNRGYTTTLSNSRVDWFWDGLRAVTLANGDVLLVVLGGYNDNDNLLLFLRLNPAGEEVWRQYFRLEPAWLQSFRLSAMPGGGFSFGAGRPIGLSVTVQPWVARMGDDGKLSWWMTFGDNAEPGGLYALEKGHLVGGGYYDGAWLASLKGDGAISWRNTLVLSQPFYASAVLPVSGGFLLAGTSGLGDHAFSWVIKFDSTGAIPNCTTAATPGQPMLPIGLNLRDTRDYRPASDPGKFTLVSSNLNTSDLDIGEYWNCTTYP